MKKLQLHTFISEHLLEVDTNEADLLYNVNIPLLKNVPVFLCPYIIQQVSSHPIKRIGFRNDSLKVRIASKSLH